MWTFCPPVHDCFISGSSWLSGATCGLAVSVDLFELSSVTIKELIFLGVDKLDCTEDCLDTWGSSVGFCSRSSTEEPVCPSTGL